MNNNIAITGFGIVGPQSCDKTFFWESFLSKKVFAEINFIPNTNKKFLCGLEPVIDECLLGNIEKKKRKYVDKQVLYSLVGSDLALKDSELNLNDTFLQEKFGVFLGTVYAQVGFGLEQVKKVVIDKSLKISPYTGLAFYIGASTGEVSTNFKTKGENCTVVSGANTALDSIMHACNSIKREVNIAAFAGASENIVRDFYFANMDFFTETKYVPYDQKRSGCFLTNGSGVVLVENLNYAKRRGAKIYAEILSYCNFNAHSCFFKLNDDLIFYICKTINSCLEKANLTANDIDLVLPTASGTFEGDFYEMQALLQIFKRRKNLIYSPKANIGYFNNIIDLYVAAMAMNTGVIPCFPENIEAEISEFNPLLINNILFGKEIQHVLLLQRDFWGGRLSGMIIKKHN